MNILDAILAPFYIALIFFFAAQYKNSRLKGSALAPYFLPGLAFKLFGTICFAMIYQFYYGGGKLGGDTSYYWRYGNSLQQILLNNPSDGFRLLLYKPGTPLPPDLLIYMGRIPRLNAIEMFQMAKIVSLITVFSAKTYLNTAFLFGTFAFVGQWKIFEVFAKRYPSLTKPLAIVCLFTPSLAFWGSSILKDTLCIGSLGFVFFNLNNIVMERKNLIRSSILLAFFTLAILSLKAYIILAFIPAAALWFVFNISSKIKNKGMRLLLFVVLGGLSLPLGFVVLSQLAKVSQKYQLEKLEELAEGFHSYHGRLHESGSAGSGYTLPFYGFTPVGILRSLPAAVNVTLYRPYIWEARSPVMLISAMESLAFLLFSIYLIFKAGVFRFFKYFGRADVVLCMTFSIILALAIGITAFNFGALVRFKIPLIPFFASGLLIIYHFSQEEAKAKKETLMRRRMWSKQTSEGPQLAK
jgi:hypothetical protein